MRKLIVFAAAVLALGTTAALTYAADRKIAAAPSASSKGPAKTAVVVVPDVRNEAFVFAKEQLQDAGFSWRVVGRVHGYAANTVVGQSPGAGTKVRDTGAPPVTLTLAHTKGYPEVGRPEDVSPYAPSRLRLASPSQ